MYNVKCAHCGTVNSEEGNCVSCGAALPVPIKRFENRTLSVRPDRLLDARQVLGQCGFEEVSCIKLRGMYELKLQRNVNMPSYNKIVDLSNEIIRDLQPELPRKGYGGFMAFFIVFLSLSVPFWITALSLFFVGMGLGDGSMDNITNAFLIVCAALDGVALVFMCLMIGRINVYKRRKKAYNAALAEVRAKADVCQKIVLAVDDR